MKIGIITFHWSTNYGAVLQVYALQEFLKRTTGHDVYVINYAPYTNRESLFRCFLTKYVLRIPQFVKNYFKERSFVPFREKHLNTTIRYYTLDEMMKNPPDMDVYICGSDQVWNPFIVNYYGVPYFMPFGNDKIRRIAYAVSFGCVDYPEKEMNIIKPYIQRFQKISVRENTGIDILEKAGIENAVLMPDPTLLLEEKDFERLLNAAVPNPNKFTFFYVLQEKQAVIGDVYSYVKKNTDIETISNQDPKQNTMDVESWLLNIRDAKFVVTNSFHGVVFAILFQTDFIAIPVEGKLAGMNDRIYTLLKKFGLQDRIYDRFDANNFDEIMGAKIDWVKVREIQEGLKITALNFFKESLT